MSKKISISPNQLSLERPGHPITQLDEMGIFLDGGDLAELLARRAASIISGNERLTPGALSFSVTQTRGDKELEKIIARAVDTGRFELRTKNTGRNSQGNFVLRPTGPQDETVAEALQRVDTAAMGPALQFFQDMKGQVHDMTILPSASQGKLNAVRVQMQPKEKNWLGSIGKSRRFPIGRGILLGGLDMGAEEYIENENDIMAKLREIGVVYGAKYISLLFRNADERMFVSIAGGPSVKQTAKLFHELEFAGSSGDASRLIADEIQLGENVRERLFQAVAEELGVRGESISNQPYVMVDIGNATIVSGGITPLDTRAANGIGLFTLGDKGIFVYPAAGHPGVSPIGVKILQDQEGGHKPLIPEGYQRNQPGPSLINPIKIERLADIIQPTDTYTTLSIPHHAGHSLIPVKS